MMGSAVIVVAVHIFLAHSSSSVSLAFWRCTRMKILSILFPLLLTGCGKQAKLDGAKLERLLSGGEIDRVEVVVLLSDTNILTGPAAQQYILSFRETNRVAEADWTKAEVATEVCLISGTNHLGWLSQFDNGLWKFEQYSFRLRASP